MAEDSGEKWERLCKVEVWANYGDDALDWEFCVDDLEVQFYELPMAPLSTARRGSEQAVLGEGF